MKSVLVVQRPDVTIIPDGPQDLTAQNTVIPVQIKRKKVCDCVLHFVFVEFFTHGLSLLVTLKATPFQEEIKTPNVSNLLFCIDLCLKLIFEFCY